MNRPAMRMVWVCLAMGACSSTRSVVLDSDVAQRDSAPPVDGANPTPADDGQPCTGCEILVGVLASQSGLLAGTHEGIIEGAQLACDEINAEGGVLGMPIGLRIEDDGTAASSAVDAFERLVADPSVVAVIGPTSTEAAVAVAARADAARIAAVSTSATGDLYGVPGASRSGSFFRTVPTEATALWPRGDNALRTLLQRATAGVDAPTGRVVRIDNKDGSGFGHAYDTVGSHVAVTMLSPPASYGVQAEYDVDALTGAAASAVSKRPTFVVLGSLIADGATMTHALKGQLSGGYRPVLIGHWPAMFQAFVDAADPEVIEGMIGLAPRPPAHALQYAHFAAAFRIARNKNPPLFAEGAYDATYLIAYGLAALKSVDRGALPESMRALSGPPGKMVAVRQWKSGLAELAASGDFDYDGAAGALDWDWRGEPNVADSRTGYVMYTVKAGRIETVPWPESP